MSNDRRNFLTAAASALADGPSTNPSVVKLITKTAARLKSEEQATLHLLAGLIRLGRMVADSHWVRHSPYCECKGCVVGGRADGLHTDLDRRIMPLLDISYESIESDLAGPQVALDGETFADDLRELLVLAEQSQQLWDAERDEDGNVIPWRADTPTEVASR